MQLNSSVFVNFGAVMAKEQLLVSGGVANDTCSCDWENKKSPIKDGVRWSLLNLFSTSPREPGRQSRTPVSNRRGAQPLIGCPAVPTACAQSSSALARIAGLNNPTWDEGGFSALGS